MRDVKEDRIIMNSIIEVVSKSGYTAYEHHDTDFSVGKKILEKINKKINTIGLYATFRTNQTNFVWSNIRRNNFCICEENDKLRFGGYINYYSNGSNDDQWSSYYVTISIWPVIHDYEQTKKYEFDIDGKH